MAASPSVVSPTTAQKIEEVLQQVSVGMPAIEGMTLTTWGGMKIASVTSVEFDDIRLGAVASGLQGMSKMALGLFDIGKMQTVTLRGANGFLMLTDVGDIGILAVITSGNAQLGSLIFSLTEASKKIRELLPKEITEEITVPDYANSYLGFDAKKINFKKVASQL